MKREIKFRAWQDNQMLMQNGHGVYKMKYFLNSLYQDCHIMQYTGLKDKKGNEIYEGDMLRITDHRTTPFEAIVYFKNGSFWLYEHNTNVDNGVFDGDMVKETTWSIELVNDGYIIGNIHENPELL